MTRYFIKVPVVCNSKVVAHIEVEQFLRTNSTRECNLYSKENKMNEKVLVFVAGLGIGVLCYCAVILVFVVLGGG